MKRHTFLPLVCALLATQASAQTITFDTDDYKAVSVYDSWEDSPLRTGKVEGNAQVVDNPFTYESETLGYAPNATEKIAGMQRSRYGGNLQGIRIDLKETFRLTKEARYAHVMVYRPVADSRVMLITLGKRSERAGQSNDVEQTWSFSSSTIGADGWYDAVFALQGFSYADESLDGIDIYSLVVCPDVTDRSQATEDFACYIDQIEINDDPAQRFYDVHFYGDYYPVSFDKDTKPVRTDRSLNAVSVSGGGDGTQSYTGLSSLIYNDGTAQPAIFNAKAGETLQPQFNYTGAWMDGYVYVDWDGDGNFSYAVNNDGTLPEGTDLVCYNGYQVGGTWYDSDGNTHTNGNVIAEGVPAFTVPSGAEVGLYRMRFKVDWNSIDPAGNTNSDNLLVDNGGGIADVLLNIHGTEARVTASQLNGDIVPADDEDTPLLNYRVSYGNPLRIRAVPAPGFSCNGIRVRYGYNLDGDSLISGNPQYFDTYYTAAEFDENNELTLPAELFACAQVEIEGYMVSDRYLTLKDEAVDSPSLTEVLLTGERERAYEMGDNTHSLQDFTGEEWVPVQVGNAFRSNVEGGLYIDLNRDGLFSLVTEAVGDTLLSTLSPGIYRAAIDGETYQVLFLVNIMPERVSLGVSSLNGRIIAYQTYPTEEISNSTGVAEQVLPYKFLGLVAQPLVDGYECGEATVRVGYGFDAELSKDGIRQWREFGLAVGDDGKLRVPQDSVWGNVRITADFEASGEQTYELAFSDEFDGEDIDGDKWAMRERGTATWNRFISGAPRVAFLQDGSLVCRAIVNDDTATDDAAMLTGMRQTSNSYGLLHGYVEVRAITTPHSGNFPAIWMMPMDQSDGWPACGEIDIWEQINTQNTTYHTVHSYWTRTLGNTSNPQYSTNKSYNMDGEWHTYGLRKEEDKLTWYVDGTQVFSYAKSDDEDALANGQWPFDKEFYLILNQSVGDGSWAANYDSAFTYETRFDWARVYALTEAGEDAVRSPSADGTQRERHSLYDLSGRSVTAPRHGVYIRDNKKVVM